jgi:CheY-like chemotaxis protein
MHIDAEVPSRVRGDPVRLRQVVLNLLSNAIKFTSSGEVVMRVTTDGRRDGRPVLRFEVTDTGVGIPPAVQEVLFQPFVQADSSTTRRFGGTGLGLAICKRLAELMLGEIGVTSTGEGGSIFWFTAVLDHPLEPVPALTLAPSLLEGQRALIVDDNATNRKLLIHLCTAWRMPHRVADGALSGLNEIRAAAQCGEPIDLVILDHHMPDIDGLGFAAMVLADTTIPRATFVMLTSRGERLLPEQMNAHGLAACELKPVHPEKLRSTLARIMATTRSKLAPSSAPALPLPKSPEPTPQNTSVSILVAEDNIVNQKVTLLQLRNLGYTADIAQNGLEAVEAVQRKAYSIVLMDAQMPVMDGMAATRRIRAAQAAGDPSFPAELRIIAMTANAMAGDREMCLDAGMDDYLAKPVRPDDLRALLARYLTNSTGPEISAACALAK